MASLGPSQSGSEESGSCFCGRPCYEMYLNSDGGRFLVAIQGDRNKPAIVTYHDIGLNYRSFRSLFQHEVLADILDHFCVYHINAPGQEDGAEPFPENYTFPTLDELADQVKLVQQKFGFKTFIGLGVGAGSIVLARYAYNYPDKVEGVCLINCTASPGTWFNWAFCKLACHLMRIRGMCDTAIDFLIWHHFGRVRSDQNPELMARYRAYFSRLVNPGNVAMYSNAFIKRSELKVSREEYTIQVPVLNVVGGKSPYADASQAFSTKLNLSTSSSLQLKDSSFVLEEEPGKVGQAFRLFLQGQGYGLPDIFLGPDGSSLTVECHIIIRRQEGDLNGWIAVLVVSFESFVLRKTLYLRSPVEQ